MVKKYLPVDALTCSHKGCPQMELLGNIKHSCECNCMIINELDSLLINWSLVRIQAEAPAFKRFTLNGL